MRHDPAGASIVIMLRSLKLHGMAQAVDDLVTQGAPAFEAATPMLSQLLKAEIAEREVRSIAYHTKVARFPSYKDLAGFDFKSSEINEATVRVVSRIFRTFHQATAPVVEVCCANSGAMFMYFRVDQLLPAMCLRRNRPVIGRLR